MTRIPINMKAATRLLLVGMILLLAFATISFARDTGTRMIHGHLALMEIPSGLLLTRLLDCL